MTQNKISWESWNVKEQDLIEHKNTQHRNLLSELRNSQNSYDMMDESEDSSGGLVELSIPHVDTPFGTYSANSVFKPSDRWDCWIAYTNFPIGEKCLKILNESVPGIEALAILGAYTFCIGVAKMFEATEVKQNIEAILCRGENVDK